MPTTSRIFVLDESGRLSGFTMAGWKRLWDGKAELPARAGQAVRFLEVPIETRNGLPVAMGEVHGLILKVDRSGRLDREQRERLRRSVGLRFGGFVRIRPTSSRGTTLPARRAVAARSDATREARWAPSPAQIDQVKAILTGRSRGE
jgi:hypothetical protein